jgi:hypothetical protein
MKARVPLSRLGWIAASREVFITSWLGRGRGFATCSEVAVMTVNVLPAAFS